MRILLQFPEGLKAKACEIANGLEAKGHEVIFSASPCFGACDLALKEAEACNADKIIHFAHAEFPLPLHGKPRIPVEFVEYPMEVEFKPVLKLALADPEFKKCRKVGLITTVQHVTQLKEVVRFLEKNGKTVFLGKHGPKVKYDGQILGCDEGAALSVDQKVDCLLYFGGGLFHPIGAAIACKHKLLSADPFLDKILWLDGEKERALKQRKGALMAAIGAECFGVIVSVKPGQQRIKEALKLKKALEGVGKKAAILVTDLLNAEALENFHCFDVYVNTACPRIVIDDHSSFGKPMLNLEGALELVRLLKSKKN